MAIHIHLHTKTKDVGPAHAPAGSSNGGQFVAGGKSAAGHIAAGAEHRAAAAKKGPTHPDTKHHINAATKHGHAAATLQAAEAESSEKHSVNKDPATRAFTAKQLVGKAEQHAQAANEHAANVKEK